MADIQKRTSYPPLVYSNATISADLTLSPQAQRDTDTPDLGYHYDPLDYAFGGTTVGNLTFTEGTAVSWFQTTSGYSHQGHGIHIADTNILSFNGTVENHDYWVRYNTVQEGNGQWEIRGGPGGMTGWATSTNTAPQLKFNFTRGSMLAGEPTCYFREDYGSSNGNANALAFIKVNAANSEFNGGILGGYIVSAAFTNCLFERLWLGMGQGYTNTYLMAQNCTMRGGAVGLARTKPVRVSIRNCAFDETAFSVSDGYTNNPTYTDYDYNAFIDGAQYTNPRGSNDILVTNFNWQTGTRGNFYLSTNSALINRGSQTADEAGLYHFTTQTNEVREAATQIDIGYHYVATACRPIDVVWVDDSIPLGGNDGSSVTPWTWVTNNPTPFSATRASQSASESGIHQQYFQSVTNTLVIHTNDTLICYAYLDPTNTPGEVMLQWNDGSWEHRAYWGANSIPWGANATAARHYMGALPPTGQWVRLEVPAGVVELEGHTLNGMAFTLYDGRATWDYAGKSGGNLCYDTDDDGIPDYQEDHNGNGILDSGETLWKLSILSHPTNQVVAKGRCAAFKVTAGGISPITYQWRFNGTNLSGQTGPTLILCDLHATNAGNYSVIVSNSSGSIISSDASLIVCSPLLDSISNLSVAAGSGSHSIALTGIAPGCAELGVLNLTASASDTNLIPTLSVSYTNPNTNGTLYFTPATTGTGVVTISVTVHNIRDTNLINGSFNFNGVITCNSNSGLSLVTNLDFIGSGQASSTNSGDFAGFSSSNIVSYIPLQFDPPIPWVDTFLIFTNANKICSVDAAGIILTGRSTNLLSVEGTALIHLTGRSNTPGRWGVQAAWSDGGGGGGGGGIGPPFIARTVAGFAGNAIVGGDDPVTGTFQVTVTLSGAGPSVSMVSPTNNQLFVLSPTNILLTATATTASGTITGVGFYNGATLLGNGTAGASNSYSLLWTNVTSGIYNLSAKATNTLGASATSASVSITVNAPPTVSIVSPTNNAVFTEVANVTLSATASDSDGTISKVDFYHGTNLIQTVTSPVGGYYTFTWNDRTHQVYPITAVATDNRGATGNSPISYFTVTSTNPSPTIQITYPTNNSFFHAGSDITIRATATDTSPGSVTNVSFYIDGKLLGHDPSDPYSITKWCWEPGTYVLTAKATDNGNAKTLSDPVNITINEQLPTDGGGFWDPVFANPGPGIFPTIWALTPGPNGSLFAGGRSLTHFGSVSAESIARWDGTNWSAMAAGFHGVVYAITVEGTNIFAGGSFTNSGSNRVSHIARWNGTNWVAIGNELGYSGTPAVFAIALVGSEVYIGGEFTSAGNDTNVQYLAKLSGTNWVPVGSPLSGPVRAITSISNTVYIGGDFSNAGGNSDANYIARLNGTTWTNLGSGVSGRVRALVACGDNLFVGGDFNEAGGDTNANCIAKWEQNRWSTLGIGVSGGIDDSESQAAPSVFTIVLRENQVFVGGEFTEVWNGTNMVSALYVARATWSEASQTWTWSSLDEGVSGFGTYDHVFSSAILQGPVTNAYDLFVGGCFTNAGASQKVSNNIGRWSVGKPYPPTVPTITITNPSSYTTFTNPTSITIDAQAIRGDTNSAITSVMFFADGAYVASGTPTNSTNRTGSWISGIGFGVHFLTATATDDNNVQGVSSPVIIRVIDSNNIVNVKDDTYILTVNSPAVEFFVLTNDLTAGLRIEKIAQRGAGLGEVAVSQDRTYLTYTPFPNTYGTDNFIYTATNSTGAAVDAWVTVIIRSKPTVQIGSPVNRFTTNVSSTIAISGTSKDYDGTVTNIDLFVNGNKVNQSTNPAFSFTWSTNVASYYSIVAVATDNHGLSNRSSTLLVVITNSSSGTHLPEAVISNLVGTVFMVGGTDVLVTNNPVIREGHFALVGRAYDDDPVSYRVSLHYPDDLENVLANLTMLPLDAQGFHSGGDTNGALGDLDLSAIPNGIYDLVLTVQGGGAEATAMVRFSLDTQLKIGQFSFSEQDLVIPVNGIPLTVIRTYNSLNTKQGDFGFNWTYALNDMDVVLDEERTNVEALSSLDGPDDELTFSLRTGGGRNVTLTLPNGERATFQFTLTNSAALDCPSCYDAKWIPPPGVLATLTTTNPATKDGAGDNTLFALFNPPVWKAGNYVPMDGYDFSQWVLTTSDGTQYEISRDLPGENSFTYTLLDKENYFGVPFKAYYIKPHANKPRLTRILQRSGNAIAINPNDITHYNPTGAVTRATLFERDGENRIIAVRDPNSGSSGLPIVRYVYNNTSGNLIQVFKLVDRATGSYLTNKYHYDHPSFPHYITSIEDARGIPIARNLYDDSGRLTGIIDAAGRTNSFEHDIAGRREVHYDRSGQPTIYKYDSQGNVTNIVDALGHPTSFQYDTNGYLLASTDALTNTTYFTNDARGNVLSVTVPYPVGADPATYTTRFTWDAFDNQTSVVLPTGGVITNVYDANGNLTETRDEAGNLISSTTFNSLGLVDSDGDKFGTNRYGFDAIGNLKLFTNSLSKVTTNSYDDNGNLTTLGDGSGTSVTSYDAQNRERTADYGHGITLTNNYETFSDWSSVDGPTIGHMERQFDTQGRLGGWVTANGSTPGFAYDVNGRLEYETNSIGVVTRRVYNAVGWLTSSTNLATGGYAAYSYDAAGRKTSQTNALGQVTWFGYWPSGSLKAMTNATGTNFWLYSDAAGACSACGNSGSVTDVLARVTESVTSAHGLPLQTIRRASAGATGANAATNSTTYLAGLTTPEQEAEEYPATVTDEGGRVRSYAYTDLGQLLTATDLGGNLWTNQYDLDTGALTNVLSPTSEKLTYSYDDLDNVKTIRFGDGNYLTNYYNAENRLNGARLPSGVYLTNFFDEAGRLTNRSSTIGETATFSFNGNDAVTQMSDNTGTTTNLSDVAGRFVGINYPSGATVRYGLDVLDRITSMTNKASAGGTAYVTRYQYDLSGSVTNVIDPFSGNTGFEYDRVGRRTKRVLPNGVVTEWKYDWRDRMTNISHKTSGGTTLASFGYVRNTGGEPNKITREDGTYVELKYDEAWRLTNEVYKTSGGSVTEEIIYGYDAAGNRTNLVKGGVTLTNRVSGGYRITAVTNASSGVQTESYGYDDGGRVTTITRDSATLNLGYNTADQVIAVTNGSAWVKYQHDANGRRTISTNSAGTVRRLLVAPTPGSNLESVHLIANASGTVQQGYVYVGDEPILRFDAAGNRVYYLEDAMGSVAALANGAGTATVASFRYDGFGNVRSQSGTTNAPSGTGGDFRFHGAWLEEGSSLYNMRAREYDARLGRFTSRDADPGNFQIPESLHTYNFANSNPLIYRDPSGQFTLIEVSITSLINSGLQALRGVAVAKGRQKALQTIGNLVKDEVLKEVKNLFPLPDFPSDWKKGLEFSKTISKFICDELHAPDKLFLEVPVSPAGEPQDNGFNCKEGIDVKQLMKYVRLRVPRPDFILGGNAPMSGKTWVVGEIKSTLAGLYREYAKPQTNPRQFNAMINYAAKHTHPKIALMICATKGRNAPTKAVIKATILKEGLRMGAIPIVLVIVD